MRRIERKDPHVWDHLGQRALTEELEQVIWFQETADSYWDQVQVLILMITEIWHIQSGTETFKKTTWQQKQEETKKEYTWRRIWETSFDSNLSVKRNVDLGWMHFSRIILWGDMERDRWCSSSTGLRVSGSREWNLSVEPQCGFTTLRCRFAFVNRRLFGGCGFSQFRTTVCYTNI